MKQLKTTLHNIKESLKITYDLDHALIPLMTAKSILAAVSPYMIIVLSSMVIDKLTGRAPVNSILQLAISGVIVILILNLASGYIDRCNSVHKDRCFRVYNTKIGEKILKMDFPQLESPKSHELRQRISDDNSWGAGLYSVFSGYEEITENLFSLVISLIIILPLFLNRMFFASWSALYFILFLCMTTAANLLFYTKYVRKHMLALMDKMMEKSKLFWYFIYEGGIDYKSGKDIRVYRSQALIRNYVEQQNKSVMKESSNKISLISGLGDGFIGFSGGLIEGIAYLFIVLKAASGILSTGAVIKFAASLYSLSKAFSFIILSIGQFAVTAERQQSSIAFFNIPDVLYKGTLPVEKRNDNQYEFEFVNVGFKYPGSEAYALKNLSLKFRTGERLAVVGMNGSGKTTMIKLLCRLYEPTEGEILLNGINIRKYDYSEYMSLFSVVFQDFRLFSFSLGQNIAASVNYDLMKVEECINKAGLKDRLSAMKSGAATPLYKDFEEDGVEISGGEAQKIALARALYKDAPFVILDEPTAALDPIAEFEFYSGFDNIAGNKTAVYISHRLSSCRFCDDIAVFHEGTLIQRGSHEKLLSDKNGKYYELWNAQAQYYNETAENQIDNSHL